MALACGALCHPSPQETTKVNDTSAAAAAAATAADKEEFFYDYGNYDDKQPESKTIKVFCHNLGLWWGKGYFKNFLNFFTDIIFENHNNYFTFLLLVHVIFYLLDLPGPIAWGGVHLHLEILHFHECRILKKN
jgi:hypothetical protein